MPVHIRDLSPPRSPNCHSASGMKASPFCLKVGDESPTAVPDLAVLTNQIRIADPGKKTGSDERERVRMLLPNIIKGRE